MYQCIETHQPNCKVEISLPSIRLQPELFPWTPWTSNTEIAIPRAKYIEIVQEKTFYYFIIKTFMRINYIT